MMKSPTPICDALGLNPLALAEQCARLLPIAQQLGHSSPRSGIVDYMHPTEREGQFLRDLFTASTENMAERYGSDAKLLNALFE